MTETAHEDVSTQSLLDYATILETIMSWCLLIPEVYKPHTIRHKKTCNTFFPNVANGA